MGDTTHDPVDHARTTRPRAGEAMKDGKNLPGLITMGLGVAALVICLFLFAAGHPTAGIVAAVAAALLMGGALTWMFFTHRRVSRLQHQWAAEHPEAAEPPRTS
ncbi:protein UsfY [[Mycobacterium] burgundiense]|jgi:hypothetical protein|uniref:Protein UsfY n=1 Tax=[Mycobacterium] burgundiense TaxID=3064286 RepID=A0ABN9NQ78_9MYCO|nr:protein UsfY [Mycolicibacterium sp. MU0053]CAJ1510306.1 protein UsfY [Mycolicibacterium sp. MU0053]